MLLAATGADATRFDLSYRLDTGTVVSAVLDGNLNNGLFTISTVESLSTNGAIVADSYTALSFDALAMGGSMTAPGSFATDGSYFDIYLWNGSVDTPSIFAIGVGNAVAGLFQSSLVAASTDLGGGPSYETFDLAAYSGQLAQASPAPEPASWAMMLGGFGILGSVMRRQRKAIVTFA